jgi:hypothetical protein
MRPDQKWRPWCSTSDLRRGVASYFDGDSLFLRNVGVYRAEKHHYFYRHQNLKSHIETETFWARPIFTFESTGARRSVGVYCIESEQVVK